MCLLLQQHVLVKQKPSFLSYVNLVCDKYSILGWNLVVSCSSFYHWLTEEFCGCSKLVIIGIL